LEALIQVEDLRKDFRQHRRFAGPFGAIRTLFTRQYLVRHAVRGISFQIKRGEAVGYVGPNGAGKSTTIKMLTGILVPTAGTVLVDGRVPHKQRRANAKRIGVVFGQRGQLWWELPVIDSFELHRNMYAIPADRYRENLAAYTALLDLDDFIQHPVRQLSLGQRMRAEIALALLHDPDILFLDEPTIGLDITAKDRIRTFLRTINREREVTILLTTHDLRDIEEICPRIVLINRGAIVYDGDIAVLKTRIDALCTIVVDFHRDPGTVELPGGELVRDEGTRKHYAFDRTTISTVDLLGSLMTRHQIRDVAIVEPGIEDVIRRIYASSAEDEAESDEIDTWTRGRAVTR
jgi:ABC-2 type transport system ATP-binding protein